MKTYTSKSAITDHETNTVWEAFVSYLDSVYFEGAAEDLAPELVNFEYEAYLSCYGK